MAIDFNDVMMEASEGPSVIIAQGISGHTPQFSIGNVESVAADAGAEVNMRGNIENPILDFKIPRGANGYEAINDNAGEGATDFVWSANKITGELDKVKNAFDLYTFVYFTTPISIDTTNHTVTIGNGFILRPRPGNFIEVTSPVTVSYTTGNVGMIVCEFTGSTFKFTTTVSNESKGFALLMISADGTKFYTPYDYTKITVDGSPISYENILSGFVPYVENNETKLDTLMSVLNYREDHIINTGTMPITTNTIWVDVYNVIPAGTFLKSISFPQSETLDMDISLWEKTGLRLVRYSNQNYSVSSVGNVCTVEINTFIEKNTVIGYNCHNTVFYGNTFANRCLLQVDDDTVTNVTYTDTQALKYCITENITILSYGLPKNSLELHVGPGYEYAEIQDALDDLTTDYATIIVHPRSTPYSRFSMMRKLSNQYPWTGLTTVKHISIIGVDKAHCIIRDDSGNYDTPPAEIATNGVIANLRFIATHDDFDAASLYPSYAVHVDNRPADPNGFHVIFDNCDLISYNTAAIGVGVYHNQTIEMRNCLIASYADPSQFDPSYDYNIRMDIGSWFSHTAMGYTEGNEKFIFDNNKFISYNATKSCVIQENDSTPSLEVEAIGNSFWAYGANSQGFSKSSTAALSPYNHGNNVSALNQN